MMVHFSFDVPLVVEEINLKGAVSDSEVAMHLLQVPEEIIQSITFMLDFEMT